MKKLLSGNEAIARGAFESGVRVASAYPGTPSTEILENLFQYDEIYTEWAPNEKVALEVGIGASIAGVRSLVIMKHVGVNVAADPLLSFSYTGLRGGLVIITADDPGMHSSQNEQDNRLYAKFAKMPMLEPSDSMEAKKFLKLAFEISEKFDTPVFLRSTTRISHSKSIVELEDNISLKSVEKLEKDSFKYVMLPAYARKRHLVVEDRLKKLSEFADGFEENKIELNSRKIGVITSSISYQYAKEAVPDASFLKLSLTYPIPVQKIKKFSKEVEKLYVVEELEPFFEEQIKALGISVKGKEVFPICGEFSPDIIKKGIEQKEISSSKTLIENIPIRPPNMCPGCPHRGIFFALKKEKVFVCGDIGCYTLSAIPPLSAMDTCICMGASIGCALGIEQSLSEKSKDRVVAVIGDSTFFHSGITPLIDMSYNKSKSVVIILDNRITAMTGRQENPASGYTANGDPAKAIDLEKLCLSIGVGSVRTINPYNFEDVLKTINEELEKDELSVIISKAPCVLLKREKVFENKKALKVIEDKCQGCKVCLQIACPAISWDEENKKSQINPSLCVGCNLCKQVCKFEAIV